MMDLKEEKRSESESTKVSSPSTSKQIKSCSDCHTTRTPLWRGGPAGPKSLCNACGIKYNKKRRELLGLDRGRNEKGKKKKKNSSSAAGKNSSNSSSGSEVAQSLRMKLMALGGEMMLRRSGKLLGKLREEEQAAILLMALSCGSVCA